MRRALAWTTTLIGVAALARLLRARRRPLETPTAEPAADPAEELRRAIDASRAEEPQDPPGAEPEESVEERRAHVHARAEETIARMREGDG